MAASTSLLFTRTPFLLTTNSVLNQRLTYALVCSLGRLSAAAIIVWPNWLEHIFKLNTTDLEYLQNTADFCCRDRLS